MMKKRAKELKKGDKITIGGQECVVESIEISDIGKQGVRKCRIEARAADGERVVIIRPDEYPIESA